MANLPPEEKINFLIACLKHTEGTPDFAAVAVECGIEKRPQARYQYKSVVEYQTKYALDGNNRIQMKDGAAIPTTPKSAKPAEAGAGTPNTSTRKRGRPKKNAAEEDDTETTAKKVSKPRATKKAKQEAKDNSDDGVQPKAEDSDVGRDNSDVHINDNDED